LAVEAYALSSASLRLPAALAPEIASYPSDCKYPRIYFGRVYVKIVKMDKKGR